MPFAQLKFLISLSCQNWLQVQLLWTKSLLSTKLRFYTLTFTKFYTHKINICLKWQIFMIYACLELGIQLFIWKCFNLLLTFSWGYNKINNKKYTNCSLLLDTKPKVRIDLILKQYLKCNSTSNLNIFFLKITVENGMVSIQIVWYSIPRIQYLNKFYFIQFNL